MPMDVSALLSTHVYAAIVLGSLVEGETTVVLAGFAAHQGYAPWWAVTLLAASINCCLDQAIYGIGRWRGDWILRRIPRLRPSVERMIPLVHRRRRWVIFGVRFMYGLRTAGPLALGMMRVPWKDFMLFNALGAAVWAALFSALGYAFGKAIAVAIGKATHYEAQAVLVLAVAGVLVFVVHRLQRMRRAAAGRDGVLRP